MSQQPRRRFAFGRLLGVLLALGLCIAGIIGGTRLYHIFMTSTGRQPPDVPDPAEYPVLGVDVSYYQGNVDWNVLAEQGVAFAFIKATEGIDHGDSQFAQNWADVQDSPVYAGAYHFYRFENDGAAQAQHFIDTVPVTENALPPVIDVELYPSLEEEPDVKETRQELQEMLDLLEAHYGCKPILYAAPNTYRTYIRYFQDDYPIWISNYYYEPYFDWTFWQYTDAGKLEGYDGDQQNIDLNVYQGSWAAFVEEFSLGEK